MSAILTAIVFVKSVSATSGIATARMDDEEDVDFQYKAFNADEGGLIEIIQANSIMLLARKYVFQNITLTIDQNMFTPGQIYVAMSRAPSSRYECDK